MNPIQASFERIQMMKEMNQEDIGYKQFLSVAKEYQLTGAQRREFFQLLHDNGIILEKNPNLMEQYQEEAELLKEALAEHRAKSERTSDWIVTRAVMEISRYRVRDIRDKGWVCGTYMSRVRERFRCWLSYLFTGEELEQLIQCCLEKKELSSHQEEVIFILLQNTPSTLVHPVSSRL